MHAPGMRAYAAVHAREAPARAGGCFLLGIYPQPLCMRAHVRWRACSLLANRPECTKARSTRKPARTHARTRLRAPQGMTCGQAGMQGMRTSVSACKQAHIK